MIKELKSDRVPNLPNYENFMKATNKQIDSIHPCIYELFYGNEQEKRCFETNGRRWNKI